MARLKLQRKNLRGYFVSHKFKFKNAIKTFKGLLEGETLTPLASFYDARYPLTKFLSFRQPKIYIKCLLCGFPRSGTHWIRNVIEKSTGHKTYNLFNEKPTISDKKILLVKIHARNKIIANLKARLLLPQYEFGGKYIYVFRDPRDAIISMYEMYKKEKKTEKLTPEDFLKINDSVNQYRWEINAWVFKKHRNVFLVRFEDLKKYPEIYFKKIFEFLDLNYSVVIESISEMVCKSDETERPRGAIHGWKNNENKYKIIIDEVKTKLGKEIELLGYEKD